MGMFSMRDMLQRAMMPQNQPGQPGIEGDNGFEMLPDGDGDEEGMPMAPQVPPAQPRPIQRGPFGAGMDRERKMTR